jgi:hypothetical protein
MCLIFASNNKKNVLNMLIVFGYDDAFEYYYAQHQSDACHRKSFSWACQYGRINILKMLDDPNYRLNYNRHLEKAASRGQLEVIQYIVKDLKQDISPQLMNKMILAACTNGYVNILNALDCDQSLEYCFRACIVNKRFDCARVIAGKISVDNMINDVSACCELYDDADFVTALELYHDIDPAIVHDTFIENIIQTMRRRHKPMTFMMNKVNIVCKFTGIDRGAAIKFACAGNSLKVVKFMTDGIDKCPFSNVLVACRRDNVEAVKYLCEKYPECNDGIEAHQTELFKIARTHQYYDLYKWLTDRGLIDPKTYDEYKHEDARWKNHDYEDE